VIVVKVEIWPNGDESRAREHTRAFIANNEEETRQTGGEFGTYNAKFMQNEHFDPKKVWKYGKAERIHRVKRGVWDIIFVALRSAGLDKRNPL